MVRFKCALESKQGRQATPGMAGLAEEPQDAARRVLRKGALRDLERPSEIVTVKASEDPREAYRRIADANVLSAPVLDEATGKYIGVLDARDLVGLIVFDYKQKHKHFPPDKIQFLDRLITAGPGLHKSAVDGLTTAYFAQRHGFRSVGEDATLLEAAELLISTRCHRVFVLDAAGAVVNVVSQSTIVQHLDKHLGELGASVERTVEETAIGTSPALCVGMDDHVLKAFEKMHEHDISGVGVVDEYGRLVANTSASDLKEFIRDPSVKLTLGAREFVCKVRSHDMDSMFPTISVHPYDKLAKVIGKLAAAKVHRVYVTADGTPRFVDCRKVLAVISITDVLRCLLLPEAEARAKRDADEAGDKSDEGEDGPKRARTDGEAAAAAADRDKWLKPHHR